MKDPDVDAHCFVWLCGDPHRQEAYAAAGRRLIVVDALPDTDLMQIGVLVKVLAFVTGGSGAALDPPAVFEMSLKPIGGWTGESEPCVIFYGSFFIVTFGQIAHHGIGHPAPEVTAEALFEVRITAISATDWLLLSKGLRMAYSSGDPGFAGKAQCDDWREENADAFEQVFAEIARRCTAADRAIAAL
jgi:uncharacterized protein YgbK (DUF1537 family)